MIDLIEAKDSHHSFIYHSWLTSYRAASFSRRIQKSIYFDNEKKIIKKILESAKVSLAVNEEDHDQIIGYCVYHDTKIPILHYVYIKKPYRGFGIGGRLLDPLLNRGKVFYTYENDKVTLENLVYNPYMRFGL